ncbi:CsiV family protein [Candidatus Spongiihabitans sp.]|uniref:CsiV family protein n=1 Tax=Candidatus Spongiihabitans sp. TaxID=3101308 RepID=UPI003C7AAB9B
MRNKSLLVVFKVVLGILLLGLGQVVYARDYAVELIVFERLDAADASAEIWDFSSQRIAGKLQKMQRLSTKAIDYETNPALINLAAIRNNLAAAGYGILHSAGWIQPAAAYQHAPLISFGAADSSLRHDFIRGFIRVYKTSLIFADIEVQYSPTAAEVLSSINVVTDARDDTRADTDSNNELSAPDTNLELQPHFFISEKRRLKFKEVHYFDHPLFGVIISVWPSES